MTKQNNYKKTLIACYLGFVTQAISGNFSPLLFLTFKASYGISLEKIALIPFVFYFTQLLVDTAATKYADKIGYRNCVVASQLLSSVGLVLMFAFLALAGDLGATVSPAMVGKVAEMAGGNLKTGLLTATVFPIVLTLGLIYLWSLSYMSIDEQKIYIF